MMRLGKKTALIIGGNSSGIGLTTTCPVHGRRHQGGQSRVAAMRPDLRRGTGRVESSCRFQLKDHPRVGRDSLAGKGGRPTSSFAGFSEGLEKNRRPISVLPKFAETHNQRK
jgi:hypothetical protein